MVLTSPLLLSYVFSLFLFDTKKLFYNLLPVTLGNMLGGVVCIGVGYWYIYSRTSYIVAPAAVKSYGSTSIVIDSSKN